MSDQSNRSTTIQQRKISHLDLCANEDVEFHQKTTLLECVNFYHDSLPELNWDDIDLSVDFLGKELRAPLLITGMTGGASQGESINRTLAQVAQYLGIAFAVGSQRAMLKDPSLLKTYQVRDVAPDIPILGNIGAVQAAELSDAMAIELVEAIQADALCIHLNPGQELIQPEGDRNFAGCLDAIARLNDALKIPIIVKETGCGLSPRTLEKISKTGVSWVDVSGAGGTTWIGVEALRAPDKARTMGELFWNWGTPTAVSIHHAAQYDFNIIGSGGLRNGLDVARSLALGATLAGMALPWLRSAHESGFSGALDFGLKTIDTIKTACLLTGSQNLGQLRRAPRHISAPLSNWLTHP